MQRSFRYGSAMFTIHRERIADELDAELIVSILMEGVPVEPRAEWIRQYHRASRYADMLVSIDTVEGDAGLPIPAAIAPAEDIRAGFNAWLNARGLYSAWSTARALANAPTADVDTSPAIDPNEPSDLT